MIKGNQNAVMIITGQLSNPITTTYIRGIRDCLAKTSFKVIVAISDYEARNEVEYLNFAKENEFAGIFMLNVIENEALIRMLDSMKSPVILVNHYLRTYDTDIVKVDDYRCGFLSTQYLISQGHTHIAHIAGPQNSITYQNRTFGYSDAMSQYELQSKDQDIFNGDCTYNSGFEYGMMFCRIKHNERPTAVYSISGTMAEGFANAVLQAGLLIPEDVSLICNEDSNRDYERKLNITCVGPDIFKMGVGAAELFLERVENCNSKIRRIVYPPVLTDYGSVRKINPINKLSKKIFDIHIG